MKRQSWVGLFILALAVYLPLGRAKTASNQNPFEGQKLQLNLESMIRNGQVSEKSVSLAQAKPQATRLPAKTRLLALVDTRCAEQGRGRSITQSAIRSRPVVLELQAFEYELKIEQSLEEMSFEAESDPCVFGVTENIPVRIAGEFTQDARRGEQTALDLIRAEQANEVFWGSSFKINQDVVIAIVDSGVQYNHPDLAAQMWKTSAGNFGIDLVNSDNDPLDDNGHGSHVAGLAAAASSNGVGVSGVFGFHAKIMAVKVVDQEGSGDIATIVNGIRYALNNGAQVINLSLVAEGTNAALQQVINEAVSRGAFVSMASGNDGKLMTNSVFISPASYGSQIDGAMSVGAIDTTSAGRSSFSNYSNVFVEIGAPGSQSNSSVGLLSTYPGSTYQNVRGTSMASPLVSGAAALSIGLLRTLGYSPLPSDIETIIKRTAIKSSALGGAFVNGNQLDLLQLSIYLTNNYIFNGDFGLENN